MKTKILEIKNKIVSENMPYKTTKSWNPFVGCVFDCTYCKPSFKALISWIGRMHHCKGCKTYAPHFHPERLSRLPSDKAIFVCEDGDIAFAKYEDMKKVIQVMTNDTKTERIWFLQSKNPKCFTKYLELLPSNTYLVTTLETNRDVGYDAVSNAPLPSQRYADFKALAWEMKVVTIEPIMDFDLEILQRWIEKIKPQAVFIGYNSRPEKVIIPEPAKEKVFQLIHNLDVMGIKVFTKEMRDKQIRKYAYRDFADYLSKN